MNRITYLCSPGIKKRPTTNEHQNINNSEKAGQNYRQLPAELSVLFDLISIVLTTLHVLIVAWDLIILRKYEVADLVF